MNNQLRIDSLNVKNYRCFKSLETPIQFHPQLTVLVARNGEGKTAFLDAVRIALGTFTSSFPITTYAHFHTSDVHIATLRENPSLGATYPVSLEAAATIDGKQISWARALQKAKGRTTKARALSQYGEFLRKKIEADENNVSLPIIAFYGTGRLWAEHRDMTDGSISPLAESRFAGYDNALSARSTYKQVKNWLLEAIQMEDSKESSNTQTGQFVASQLKAIKKALSNVLCVEGVDSMHYNRFYKDDITVICKNGNTSQDIATALPVSWLSDGLRAVFSMVADIAYRCVKLNPHLGENACIETNGIVLIDEVDIFLHPSWQQRIIGDLQRTFPNIQFIVTTHSPQVVSSVPSESIRVIAEGKVLNASIKTDGARAEQILCDIFGVEARYANSEVAKNLAEYQLLINQDQWDSERGKELWIKLQDMLSTDPVLAKLAMRVHLKEYQRAQNEKNQ
ncbi:MAG: AAA family ATPase [Lentisphaeria bacterium]|nr:AAA family ATPase [Lentisphaeria bacterium]